MDEMIDYLDKLQRDLLEQFKGKPNIEVFQRALARQLTELYEFFVELNTLRWLKNAKGVQLDGIGDIVVMSRVDALAISKLVGKNVPMDDNTYNLYLAFKMHLNTSNCTHSDVYRALKMFWDKTPLYYSEDIASPATMFFSTSMLDIEDDVDALLLAPKVKAAGVGLNLIINFPKIEMFLKPIYKAQLTLTNHTAQYFRGNRRRYYPLDGCVLLDGSITLGDWMTLQILDGGLLLDGTSLLDGYTQYGANEPHIVRISMNHTTKYKTLLVDKPVEQCLDGTTGLGGETLLDGLTHLITDIRHVAVLKTISSGTERSEFL